MNIDQQKYGTHIHNEIHVTRARATPTLLASHSTWVMIEVLRVAHEEVEQQKQQEEGGEGGVDEGCGAEACMFGPVHEAVVLASLLNITDLWTPQQ